jgi:hypothetical protein
MMLYYVKCLIYNNVVLVVVVDVSIPCLLLLLCWQIDFLFLKQVNLVYTWCQMAAQSHIGAK